MLKYRCRNCKGEIPYNDVEKHLNDGCEKQEDGPRLIDCFYKKHELRKITPAEVEKLSKEGKLIYHLISKKY